jgi:hypothetical protein
VTVRRLAALSAGAVLLGLFVSGNSPPELVRRARFLARSAPLEAERRRLGGSGTAFDRRFYVFLESVRRAAPRDLPGVAIYAPRATMESLYLASYVFAPSPVLLAPERVPPRWLAAAYGVPPPEGWRIVARVPGGVLAAPP